MQTVFKIKIKKNVWPNPRRERRFQNPNPSPKKAKSPVPPKHNIHRDLSEDVRIAFSKAIQGCQKPNQFKNS